MHQAEIEQSRIDSGRLIVTCSCGKSTALRWLECEQKFVAATDGWTRGAAGWCCGEKGHYQQNYILTDS